MARSHAVSWSTKPPTLWERFLFWFRTHTRRVPPRHLGPHTPPTVEELGALCEDFVGGAGTVRWDKDRWEILLHGACSEPLARIATDMPFMTRRFEEEEGRYIEVWRGEINGFDRVVVDVMTRQSDEFTNGAAEKLAEIIARFWRGTLG